MCKQPMCDDPIAYEVEVNAPVRGHGYDYYCPAHGEQKEGQTYVRAVRPIENAEGPRAEEGDA